MDNLDFSGLSDDQLIGLIRSSLQEAVRRHPAVQAAAQAAVLDEAEKAKIQVEAAEGEAAVQRARQRRQIEVEAAARVRAANAHSAAEREQSIRESRTREAAVEAAARAAADVAASIARIEQHRSLLLRASSLVGLPPGQISLVVRKSSYGNDKYKSVYINEGSHRYVRDHLVTYRGLELTTERNLMSRKTELLHFCADLRASLPDIHIDGSAHFSESETESKP